MGDTSGLLLQLPRHHVPRSPSGRLLLLWGGYPTPREVFDPVDTLTPHYQGLPSPSNDSCPLLLQSIRVADRIQSMVGAVRARTDTGDHQNLGVLLLGDEGVLEDHGQLGLSEGDMGALETHSSDTLLQSQKTFVDACPLHPPLLTILHRVLGSFRARQVAQSQSTLHLLAVV